MVVGIRSFGNFNRFSRINISNSQVEKLSCGVMLTNTEFSHVENLTCSGFLREGEYGLFIDSYRSTALNCKCSSVWINGNDIVLTDVDGGKEISISKNSLGVILINCRGELLRANSKVHLRSSVFDRVKKPVLK